MIDKIKARNWILDIVSKVSKVLIVKELVRILLNQLH